MNTPLRSYSAQKKATPQEYTEWQSDPSSDNYSKLVKSLDRTIQSGMASFGNKNLKTRSRIIVDRSLRTYDPEKGASLQSHVYNHLQGLQRYKAERGMAVHVPESVRLDKGHIHRFEKEYHDQHGIVPSDETISDALSVSAKRIGKVRNANELPELFTDKGDSAVATKGRSAQDVWSDYVYHDLDDVNKNIFKWTTGYGNATTMSKASIAAKLGITPAAVSSRISTISRKLEEGLNDGSGNL